MYMCVRVINQPRWNRANQSQTLHYTRRITPKRATSLRCYLLNIAPRQHSYLCIGGESFATCVRFGRSGI